MALPAMADISQSEEKAKADTSDISKKEIQAFAKVNRKIAQIRTAAAKRDGSRIIDLNAPIEKVPEGRKIPTIQALEAHGLTVEQYNQLLTAYKIDEDFRRQVVRALINLQPDPEPRGTGTRKCC